MTQDKFEELLLDQLTKIDNRIDKLDDRISALDKKVDEKTAAIENKLDDRISALDIKVDDRLDAIGKETAWIRGKLEARGEFITDIKSLDRHRCCRCSRYFCVAEMNRT